MVLKDLKKENTTAALLVESRVRPHFRFGSEIWNWGENFVLLGSEKKAWFHTIYFDAKHQKIWSKNEGKLSEN